MIYVEDLAKSKDFYMRLFDLQFSALNHPDSSAAMRLSQQEMHFFSFGFYHHDICLVKHHKLKMDNGSMMHFSLVARDAAAFEAIRRRATEMGVAVREGRMIASAKTSGTARVLPPGPEPTLDRNHRGAKTMTAVAFVPPNVLPPTLQKFAGLLKRKWFRELVLAPPTVTRRRFSNKTEDYGVFKPSLMERSVKSRSTSRTSRAAEAGTSRWRVSGTVEPARKSRIPTSRDGESAVAT